MIELDEQAEPLPTPSLAVARKVVDESSATDTVSPAAAKSAAEPVATGLPLQVGSVKSLTVEPAAAEPFTLGELSFAGESGSRSLNVGAAGGVESST